MQCCESKCKSKQEMFSLATNASNLLPAGVIIAEPFLYLHVMNAQHKKGCVYLLHQISEQLVNSHFISIVIKSLCTIFGVGFCDENKSPLLLLQRAPITKY